MSVPDARWVYAIQRPSGDHDGSPSSASSSVRRRTSVPSASISQTWPPSLDRENAMRLPSGDHDGLRSCALEEVSRFVPVPSAFMT